MPSEFGQTRFSGHHDHLTDGNENTFSNEPYFLYRQDFSDGKCFEGTSYGHSRFTRLLHHESTSSQPVFSVHKTYDPLNITVCIQSEILAQHLGLDLLRTCDVLPIFKDFTTIHTSFMDRKKGAACSESHWPRLLRELKLFIVHFLLDYAIFYDAEKIRPGSVSTLIRWRMQRGKAFLDLDHIERAFDQPEWHAAPERKDPFATFLRAEAILSDAFPPFENTIPSNTRDCSKLYPHPKDPLFTYDMCTVGFDFPELRLNPVVQWDEFDIRGESDGQIPQEDGRRGQLLSSVRKYFHNSFLTIRQNRTNDVAPYSKKKPNELSRLRIPPDPRSAWKDGFRVIRGLLRGRLPQTVEQVIHCIMTANAIRTDAKIDSYTKEEHAPHFHDAQQRLTLKRFVRDLDRWRDAVHVGDRHLFEEVVFLLFGKHLGKIPRVYHSDNLYHFQELFQNLLSETGIEELESDWHGGTRLSVIQARHAEGSGASADTQPDSVSTPDIGMSTHPPETYTEIWNAHDFKVIELASTVIFCILMAALLFLYHPVAHAQATLLMQNIFDQSSEPSVIHKRNFILLACYLGLSTHTIENIPFNDGSDSKTPRPCRLCGKRVTNSNMKRHERTHKPEEHGCHYCPSKFSRNDNRVTHEKGCQIKKGEPAPPNLSSCAGGLERGLGSGWIETSQPTILNNTDLNQGWSDQPTHNYISRPFPHLTWSNVAEAPAPVLSPDSLTSLSQGFSASELDDEPSPEDQLLLEQYTVLNNDELEVLLNQPLSSLESETRAAQIDLVTVDMDMEDILSLSDRSGFSWVEPVAEGPLNLTAPVMLMEDAELSIEGTFDFDAFELLPAEFWDSTDTPFFETISST